MGSEIKVGTGGLLPGTFLQALDTVILSRTRFLRLGPHRFNGGGLLLGVRMVATKNNVVCKFCRFPCRYVAHLLSPGQTDTACQKQDSPPLDIKL